MPAAFELRGQECFHDVEGGTYTYDSCAETQDVRIVVLPRQPGHQPVHAKRGARALHPVRRDRNTDAGAADDNALLGLAGGYRFTDRAAEIRVIVPRSRTSCPASFSQSATADFRT